MSNPAVCACGIIARNRCFLSATCRQEMCDNCRIYAKAKLGGGTFLYLCRACFAHHSRQKQEFDERREATLDQRAKRPIEELIDELWRSGERRPIYGLKEHRRGILGLLADHPRRIPTFYAYAVYLDARYEVVDEFETRIDLYMTQDGDIFESQEVYCIPAQVWSRQAHNGTRGPIVGDYPPRPIDRFPSHGSQRYSHFDDSKARFLAALRQPGVRPFPEAYQWAILKDRELAAASDPFVWPPTDE